MPGSSFFVFAAKPDWNVIAGNDIAVVQRCCTSQQFEFIKTCAALGLKIVYDTDDNIFDLPEFNPAHKILTRYREGFLTCMRVVDVISVSTKALAKEIRSHTKNLTNARTGKPVPILVAENRIDTRVFAPPVIREDQFIVGWAGSSSHGGKGSDLELIQGPIQRLAAKYPQVAFEFRGCNLWDGFQTSPNIVHKYWSPVAEYGARMPRWGWSIALAPLVEHPFNASKSSIKMVEAGYCGIPCLASWVQPYEEFVSHDSELRWLLCAGQSSWERKLNELINDSARRQELGQRMQRVSLEYYSFNKVHEGWQQVFEEARSI